MNNIYPLSELEIPVDVIKACGPLREFRPNVAIATIELRNGAIITGVLIVYPNYVGAIEGEDDLTFSPSDVIKVSQNNEDLKKRTKSSWVWLYDPEEFRNNNFL